jgi:hypothetical protein
MIQTRAMGRIDTDKSHPEYQHFACMGQALHADPQQWLAFDCVAKNHDELDN